MNRTFACIVLINVALLVGFILLDFVTWNAVALNLDSRVKATYENGYVSATYASYAIVQVGITAQGTYKFVTEMTSFFYISGTSINSPLIWFIVTMVVNLSLVWYLGIKTLNELKKHSKTETISPSEQEDKLEVQK